MRGHEDRWKTIRITFTNPVELAEDKQSFSVGDTTVSLAGCRRAVTRKRDDNILTLRHLSLSFTTRTLLIRIPRGGTVEVPRSIVHHYDGGRRHDPPTQLE